MPFMGEIRHGEYRIRYAQTDADRAVIRIMDTDSVIQHAFRISARAVNVGIESAKLMIDHDFKIVECHSCNHAAYSDTLKHSTTCKVPSNTVLRDFRNMGQGI